MIKKITVDKDKCIYCGMCIKDCFVNAIEFDDNKIPQYGVNGQNICLACQHCMAICPTGALSFGDKNPADSIEVGYGNSEELLQLIKSRRSYRQYKNENVPKEKLDKIIEMLSYPPTGTNSDNLHFSMVETKEKMEEIRSVTYDKISSVQNPSPMFKMAKEPTGDYQDFIRSEGRYKSLLKTNPDAAEALYAQAESDAQKRMNVYKSVGELM